MVEDHILPAHPGGWWKYAKDIHIHHSILERSDFHSLSITRNDGSQGGFFVKVHFQSDNLIVGTS
jgi:hypothetical protein